MNIELIRQKFPQYDDMTDQELANALHTKYYSDLPLNDFYSRIGFKQQSDKPQISRGEAALTTATNIPGIGMRAKAAIAAGTAKLFGGKATEDESYGSLYNEALGQEQSKLKQAREEYPVQSFTTQLASDIATGGKILKVAGLTGQGLKTVMAGGGLLSGLSTLGETEDLTNLPQVGKELAVNVPAGALTAGVLQKAVPALVEGSRTIAQLPKRLLQKATGINQEAINTFEQAGISPTLADVSNSAGLQNFVKDIPGAGKSLNNALQKQVNQISAEIQKTIDTPSLTPKRVGQQIKTGALDFKERADQRIQGLYDELDKYILSESQKQTNPKLMSAIDEWSNLKQLESHLIEAVELNARSAGINTQSGMKQLGFWRKRTLEDSGKLTTMAAEEAKSLANVRKQISNQEKIISDYEKYMSPEQFESALMAGQQKISTNNLRNLTNDQFIQDIASVGSGDTARVLNRYSQIVDEAGNVSYPRLKTFRSTVGLKLQSASLPGEERAALKKIYGALSDDMKEAVVANGGEKALQAFNKANAAFQRKTEFIEKNISPLLEAKTPEKVYKLAIAGAKEGGTGLRRIMAVLNPTQKEYIRASLVRDMGLAPKTAQGAEGDVFSPTKFMAEYNTFRKTGADKAIFTEAQRNAYNKLNKVIELTKNTEQAGKSKNLLQAIGLTSVGVTTGPVGLATTIGGARITSRMMSDPRFVNWLARSPDIKPAQMPKYISQLSSIATANPEVREDVLDYLQSITIGDANAQDTTPSEQEYRQSLERQRQLHPVLMEGIDIEKETQKYKKRYLKT